MPSLAGTKRPAETPVASPNKATAFTKRCRTHYDYYDDEDGEESEEEQWSGDEWSDDSSVMDLDDADEANGEVLSPDDLGDDDFEEKAAQQFIGVSAPERNYPSCAGKLTMISLTEMMAQHGVFTFLIAPVTLTMSTKQMAKSALIADVLKQDVVANLESVAATASRRATTSSTNSIWKPFSAPERSN